MRSWHASVGEATAAIRQEPLAAGLNESVTDSQTKPTLYTESVGTKTQQSGTSRRAAELDRVCHGVVVEAGLVIEEGVEEHDRVESKQ